MQQIMTNDYLNGAYWAVDLSDDEYEVRRYLVTYIKG